MTELSLEVWNSNHNRQERHYFLVEDVNSELEEGQYLFGVNPELVTPEQEQQILKLLGR